MSDGICYLERKLLLPNKVLWAGVLCLYFPRVQDICYIVCSARHLRGLLPAFFWPRPQVGQIIFAKAQSPHKWVLDTSHQL